MADKRNGIQIREDPSGGIVIFGVQEEPCKTSKDVVQ